MELKEQAIQEILKSHRGSKRIEGYKYLIGKTMHGFGIAVAWDFDEKSIAILTMEKHKDILGEAKKAGVRKPIRIYATANGGPSGSPSYEIIQVGFEHCSLKRFANLKKEVDFQESFMNDVHAYEQTRPNRVALIKEVEVSIELIKSMKSSLKYRGLSDVQRSKIDDMFLAAPGNSVDMMREIHGKITLEEFLTHYKNAYSFIDEYFETLKEINKQLKAKGK